MSKDGIDVIHHLADSKVLEFEFLGYEAQIHLPEIHAFGMDLSITKHVLMMWVAAGLLVLIFSSIAKQKSLVPRGTKRNLFEFVLLFIRDEVVRPNMGKDGEKYLPFIWTLFFFILFCNLLGLVPYAATATGNITVTASLALISFCFVHGAGMAENGVVHYLQSIVPPVPWLLWPLMLVIEIIGHLVKPLALTLRLFFNMMSGHIVLLVVLGFIFVLPGVFQGFASMATVAVCMLELLVAFLQAFIFTFLTAVFMGFSMHPEH